MIKNKALKISIYTIVIIYSLIGFGLTTVFFAIKLHLTDDPGSVDVNDRYFQNLAQPKKSADSLNTKKGLTDWYTKIMVLEKFYPQNAELMLKALSKNPDPRTAEKMFAALDLLLAGNNQYQQEIQKTEEFNKNITAQPVVENLFAWMNMPEWKVFKEAVVKDSALIYRAARESDLAPRLIVSALVGEQIRLFNSEREAYKKWIGPLKILSNETKISLGVTGIKEETAILIEKYLKDSTSVYYPGKKYEKLLDFQTQATDSERYKRLTSYRNHYYSYIYAGLFIRQVQTQWQKAGFDISDRPEILATLFNVGFPQSHPKAAPRVGGSTIEIKGERYTFGMIAYQFYFSGELAEVFPL